MKWKCTECSKGTHKGTHKDDPEPCYLEYDCDGAESPHSCPWGLSSDWKEVK